MRNPARFLRDLAVGRRLALGFGAVLALLVALGVVTFGSYVRLESSAGDVNGQFGPIAEGADGVRLDVANLLASQASYVLDNASSRSAFEERALSLQQDLTDVSRQVGPGREASMLAKMQSEVDTFLKIDATIFAAVQRGDHALAESFVLGPGRLTIGYLDDDARILADFARQDQASAIRMFDATLTKARVLMWSLGAAAILVGAVVALAIARTIRRPLAILERAARRAAEGDLDVHVDADSADETGRLVKAFNTMVSGLRESVAETAFDQELRTALDMVDTEDSALGVIADAMRSVASDRPAEFLVADSSKAHLQQAVITGPLVAGPCCPVESPFSCAAVRNGQVAVFDSSEALGACPKLKDRPGGALSAACVPVTFMGRAMGVIHMIGEEHNPPPHEVVNRLRALATQAGARIGTVRAFERSHLQASTDPLTGLVNRRTLETKARELLRQGRPYTVLLGDLDHFKRLNDTHGHDAGDRALRLFGMVVKEAVRESDIAARYGGEEFAVVLPTQGVAGALAVAQRIRTRLADALSSGDTPAFTVSMGISASRPGVPFDDVLRESDQALYRAKETGRDRVVVADEAGPVEENAPVHTSFEVSAFESTEGIFAHMNEPDPVMDRHTP